MRSGDDSGNGWRELEDLATALPPRPLPGFALGGAGRWWVARVPGWSLLDGLQVGATAAAWLVPGVGLPLAALAGLP